MGAVVEVKVVELEDEVRKGFSRHLRKELTGVLVTASGKRSFLERCQDVCDDDMNLNQLTSMAVYRIPMIKEAEVTMIYTKPEELVHLDKGVISWCLCSFRF